MQQPTVEFCLKTIALLTRRGALQASLYTRMRQDKQNLAFPAKYDRSASCGLPMSSVKLESPSFLPSYLISMEQRRQPLPPLL